MYKWLEVLLFVETPLRKYDGGGILSSGCLPPARKFLLFLQIILLCFCVQQKVPLRSSFITCRHLKHCRHERNFTSTIGEYSYEKGGYFIKVFLGLPCNKVLNSAIPDTPRKTNNIRTNTIHLLSLLSRFSLWFCLLHGLNASATGRLIPGWWWRWWNVSFWQRKPEYPEETTNLRQVPDKLSHIHPVPSPSHESNALAHWATEAPLTDVR